MKDCDHIRESLLDLLYGELEREEAARVREHLEQCPDCAREFDELRDTLKAVRTLPDPPVPGAINARVRELAREEAEGDPDPIGKVVSFFAQLPRMPLAAAAVLVMAFTVALVYSQLYIGDGSGKTNNVAKKDKPAELAMSDSPAKDEAPADSPAPVPDPAMPPSAGPDAAPEKTAAETPSGDMADAARSRQPEADTAVEPPADAPPTSRALLPPASFGGDTDPGADGFKRATDDAIGAAENAPPEGLIAPGGADTGDAGADEAPPAEPTEPTEAPEAPADKSAQESSDAAKETPPDAPEETLEDVSADEPAEKPKDRAGEEDAAVMLAKADDMPKSESAPEVADDRSAADNAPAEVETEKSEAPDRRGNVPSGEEDSAAAKSLDGIRETGNGFRSGDEEESVLARRDGEAPMAAPPASAKPGDSGEAPAEVAMVESPGAGGASPDTAEEAPGTAAGRDQPEDRGWFGDVVKREGAGTGSAEDAMLDPLGLDRKDDNSPPLSGLPNEDLSSSSPPSGALPPAKDISGGEGEDEKSAKDQDTPKESVKKTAPGWDWDGGALPEKKMAPKPRPKSAPVPALDAGDADKDGKKSKEKAREEGAKTGTRDLLERARTAEKKGDHREALQLYESAARSLGFDPDAGGSGKREKACSPLLREAVDGAARMYRRTLQLGRSINIKDKYDDWCRDPR